MPPTLRKESPTHRTQVHWWFAGVAAGCEKERESARSRARGDEKAWSGGIGTTVLLQLSTIGGAINS